MKCISCNADVPPQWVHAINVNQCPGCGKEIMNEDTKTLLVELREAMSKMPNDPEGLAGWLISNYNLSKIGDAEPTNFHRAVDKQIIKSKPISKINNLDDEDEVILGEKLASDERVAIFAKNAGISNNKNLAEIAKKIKGSAIKSATESMPLSLDDFNDEEYYSDHDDDQDFDPEIESVVQMLAKDSDQVTGGSAEKQMKLQELKARQASKKMKSGGGAFSRLS